MVRVHPNLRIPLLGAMSVLLAGIGAVPAPAQTVVLDEGTFTIFVSGQEVGTETFTIRRQGSEPEATFLANAVVTMEGVDGSQMRPTLQAGSDRAPIVYENPIEDGDISMVGIRNMGRRFVATISSVAGERERELRAEQGSRLLDRWVAHHHWFLEGTAEGTSIPVLIPRTGEQVTLTVGPVTSEPLQVGGQRVQARRMRLTGDPETRDVWFDEQGRVLQVEVPGRDYRAVRQSL